MMFTPRNIVVVLVLSDPVENNDRWGSRQCLTRDTQGPLATPVDLEFLADPPHEILQWRFEPVHRQDDGGAQAPRDLGHAVQRHRIGAIDRHHQYVEPADRREMAVVELHMQMPEMADAEPGDLENENRVAVLDHVGAGMVAVEAADVGRDIADEDVADL